MFKMMLQETKGKKIEDDGTKRNGRHAISDRMEISDIPQCRGSSEIGIEGRQKASPVMMLP